MLLLLAVTNFPIYLLWLELKLPCTHVHRVDLKGGITPPPPQVIWKAYGFHLTIGVFGQIGATFPIFERVGGGPDLEIGVGVAPFYPHTHPYMHTHASLTMHIHVTTAAKRTEKSTQKYDM